MISQLSPEPGLATFRGGDVVRDPPRSLQPGLIAYEASDLAARSGDSQDQPMLRVRRLEHWPDADLLARWKHLWHRQELPLPFTHPDWVESWWRHLGKGRRLALYIVESNGELQAVAPLFAERIPQPPGLHRIVGFGTTNDYNDWLLPENLVERRRVACALFQALRAAGGWSIVEVNGVRADSALASVLPVAQEAGLRVTWRPGLPCPMTRLNGTWAEYLARRPRTLRYHLRSRLTRLAALGQVEFRSASTSELGHSIRESMRLHALRWASEENDAIFSSSNRGAEFYRDALRILSEQGLADVTTMSVSGSAVASVVGFTIRSRYYYYIPSYDPMHAANVPGKLIIGHLMERAFANGYETFDFMLGDEPYKREWATAPDPSTITVSFLHPSVLGRLGHTGARLLRAMRRHLSKAPALRDLSRRFHQEP